MDSSIIATLHARSLGVKNIYVKVRRHRARHPGHVPGSYVVADDVSLLIMGPTDRIECLQKEAGR